MADELDGDGSEGRGFYLAGRRATRSSSTGCSRRSTMPRDLWRLRRDTLRLRCASPCGATSYRHTGRSAVLAGLLRRGPRSRRGCCRCWAWAATCPTGGCTCATTTCGSTGARAGCRATRHGRSGPYFDRAPRRVRAPGRRARGGVPRQPALACSTAVITVHPLGGCPMGRDAGEGVVAIRRRGLRLSRAVRGRRLGHAGPGRGQPVPDDRRAGRPLRRAHHRPALEGGRFVDRDGSQPPQALADPRRRRHEGRLPGRRAAGVARRGRARVRPRRRRQRRRLQPGDVLPGHERDRDRRQLARPSPRWRRRASTGATCCKLRGPTSLLTLDRFRRNALPALGARLASASAPSTARRTFNVYNFSRHELEVIAAARMNEDLLIACVSLPMWFPPVEIGGDDLHRRRLHHRRQPRGGDPPRRRRAVDHLDGQRAQRVARRLRRQLLPDHRDGGQRPLAARSAPDRATTTPRSRRGEQGEFGRHIEVKLLRGRGAAPLPDQREPRSLHRGGRARRRGRPALVRGARDRVEARERASRGRADGHLVHRDDGRLRGARRGGLPRGRANGGGRAEAAQRDAHHHRRRRRALHGRAGARGPRGGVRPVRGRSAAACRSSGAASTCSSTTAIPPASGCSTASTSATARATGSPSPATR